MEELLGKEHLVKLPLRAIVAFAARSARRVLSPSHTPHGEPESVQEVSEIEVLISHAEGFAANRPPREASWQVENIGTEAQTRPIDHMLAAAHGAADAASAAIRGNGPSVVASAVESSSHAASAFPESVAFMLADLRFLKDMRLGKFPEVGNPIEPGVAGPLGPLDSEGRFLRWRKWLEEDLLHQIEAILLDSLIFDAFRESLQPYVGQTRGGEIAEWIARNYSASACSAIRRLGDEDTRSVSLRRLFEEMKLYSHILTRSNFAAFVGEMNRTLDLIAGDGVDKVPLSMIDLNLKSLHKESERLNSFVNKFIAHSDADRHKIRQPTYSELDNAVAVVHKLYRKYALLLAEKSCQLDNPNPADLIPGDYEDHKSCFERLWKDSEEESNSTVSNGSRE